MQVESLKHSSKRLSTLREASSWPYCGSWSLLSSRIKAAETVSAASSYQLKHHPSLLGYCCSGYQAWTIVSFDLPLILKMMIFSMLIIFGIDEKDAEKHDALWRIMKTSLRCEESELSHLHHSKLILSSAAAD